MDLAEGHVNALQALDRDATFAVPATAGDSAFGGSGGRYKAYNLGKGKGMSVLQMVAAMKEASGFDYKYTKIGRRFVRIFRSTLTPSTDVVRLVRSVGDVPDLTADPSLAEKELGFKAIRDLKAMVDDQWRYQSLNPNGYE